MDLEYFSFNTYETSIIQEGSYNKHAFKKCIQKEV
jgi:hypothetical protein